MKKLKFSKIIRINEKAMGLVEALVSLAVVATGMVIITSLSLKTIKQVRRNEMQDVAVQIGVEAMDFMKQPGKIKITNIANINGYYSLDISIIENAQIIKENDTEDIYECDAYSSYRVDYVTDMNMCQQIQIQTTDFADQYDIRVIVVWDSIGSLTDEYEIRVFTGYRQGGFK